MELAYTGQYTLESPPIGGWEESGSDGCDQGGLSSNTRKRKRSRFLRISTPGSTGCHPSILHLNIYAAAVELSFGLLKCHSERALIASLGVLFDQVQFIAFIKELYSRMEYRELRGPTLNIIMANLKRFRMDSYALIDNKLLEAVPSFRDHLLAGLLDKHCQESPPSAVLRKGNLLSSKSQYPSRRQATSTIDYSLIAFGVLGNQKAIIQAVEGSEPRAPHELERPFTNLFATAK